MTSDQVRWKINALLKKYKEVVDNYSKSGRGNIEFDWFQQMDDILVKRKIRQIKTIQCQAKLLVQI